MLNTVWIKASTFDWQPNCQRFQVLALVDGWMLLRSCGQPDKVECCQLENITDIELKWLSNKTCSFYGWRLQIMTSELRIFRNGGLICRQDGMSDKPIAEKKMLIKKELIRLLEGGIK